MVNCEVKIETKDINKRLQLKNAKDFLNFSKQVHPDQIPYHKIYKLDNTYQLCDSFTAIILNNKIDGLDVNQSKYEYIDFRKLIDSTKIVDEYVKIDINIQQLKKQAIIANKLECVTFPYTTNLKNSFFNPIFLLRAIRILGTENVTLYVHNNDYKEPVYLKSPLGEAFVLPIVPPKDMRK